MTRQTKKTEGDFKDYQIGFDPSNRNVELYLKDQLPNNHLKIVGEFSADLVKGLVKGDEDAPRNTNNLLEEKVKEILEDLGVKKNDKFNFYDRASNAPVGSDYIPTNTEHLEVIAEGESVEDYQKEVSDNVEKTDKKLNPEKASAKK